MLLYYCKHSLHIRKDLSMSYNNSRCWNDQSWPMSHQSWKVGPSKHSRMWQNTSNLDKYLWPCSTYLKILPNVWFLSLASANNSSRVKDTVTNHTCMCCIPVVIKHHTRTPQLYSDWTVPCKTIHEALFVWERFLKCCWDNEMIQVQLE